jgi:hypothetical protein
MWKYVRSVVGASGLEASNARDAKVSLFYVFRTGTLCVIRLEATARNVERNMYHSVSAKTDTWTPLKCRLSIGLHWPRR